MVRQSISVQRLESKGVEGYPLVVCLSSDKKHFLLFSFLLVPQCFRRAARCDERVVTSSRRTE